MAKRQAAIVKPEHSLSRQNGIAALLLVLLTGLSATVVAMGTMSYVRGSQKSQMTVHAQTQSEIHAWAGVQALTNYLDNHLNEDPDTSLDEFLKGLGNLKFNKAGSSTHIASASYQSGCSNTIGNSTVACFNVTGSSADSNTPLQVVYRIAQNTPPTLQRISTPMVFNGNLNISGGGLDVLGNDHYRNIAVNGDITMQSAATSDISGCATGNIIINGGGITDHGHLYSSGGSITVDGQNVNDVSLWGDDVTINGGGGTYQAIRANGNISINNASIDTVGFMHGNNINVNPGGSFTDVRVNNNFRLGNGDRPQRQFGTLTGGGDFIVSSTHHLPIFDQPSTIAGQVRVGGDSGTVVGAPISHLRVKQPHPSPGLVGFPDCNVDVTGFDVNNLMAQANYIFYFDETSGDPMLRIQNVNKSDGTSMDRTVNLKDDDVRTLGGQGFLQCGGWSGGAPCSLSANTSDGWTFTDINAFPPGIVLFGGRGNPDKKNLAHTKFKLNGIMDNVGSPIYNTLLSTGDLTLARRGRNIALTAPNFADAEVVCGQDFYPRQLCDKNGGDIAFVKTKNSDGKLVHKFPLANNAVMTNLSFTTEGWKIAGHVLVGRNIDTSAGTTSIKGGLSVGLNPAPGGGGKGGDTEIKQGGLEVDTSKLTPEQLLTFTGSGGDQGLEGGGASERELAGYRVRSL